MRNNLADKQQNEELCAIAQHLRAWNYELNEDILTQKEEEELEKKLQQEKAIFIDKCYTYFRIPAFRKAQKEQKRYGATHSLEATFNSAFNDLLLFELLGKVLNPELDLATFNFGAFVVGTIGKRMIDAYRKSGKEPTTYSFSEKDDTLSPEEKIMVREKIQELTTIFHRIIPNKLDRILLRWTINNISTNESVAKVFGFENIGSVRVRKARLMRKVMTEIPKDLFIVSQEISIINEFIDEEKLQPLVVTPYTQAELTKFLFTQNKETGEEIFDKELAPWILLRWQSLLNPADMEQAHVYEFGELTDLVNYQRAAMNQLVNFLKKIN